jgi:hypothetical protein
MNPTNGDRSASLRHGNLHFVPVLRQRLAFAEQVRRAIAELQQETPWSAEHDLIVVSLPASLREELELAIKKLPRVSLLVAVVDGVPEREVFGVTPCDPFVEAVRTASKQGWPLEFTDLEIAPGNLLHSMCVQDREWPDDALLNCIGLKNYLELITGYFAAPPARAEPLDTWRESAITRRLRAVQPVWRRILVVLDAGLYAGVAARLTQSPKAEEESLFTPAAGCRVETRKRLPLEVLLHYLDDYPRLVERYEETRKSRATFSKPDMLRNEVIEFARGMTDMKFSVRQYLAFASFLRKLVALGRRESPQPHVLQAAATGCFGQAFAERLICHLAGYNPQIKSEVERVSANPWSSREFTVRFEVAQAPDGQHFSRVCNPRTSSFVVVPPSPPPTGDKSDATFAWKGDYQAVRQLQSRLPRLVAESHPEPAVLPYRGSIHNGIQIRRTLRARYRGERTFYVKAARRSETGVPLKDEPVVWICTEETDESASFGSIPLANKKESFSKVEGRNQDSFRIGAMRIVGHTVVRTLTQTKSGGELLCANNLGWITFGPQLESVADARSHFGNAYSLRYPDHGAFKHPDNWGCVHPDFVPLTREGHEWIAIAILTALKYADQRIILAAPLGVVVPEVVRRHPLMSGKTIELVSINRYSRQEREMIGSAYQFVSGEGDDREAIAAFRIAMRRYLPGTSGWL